MKPFINRFIGARFWILPLYVLAYYLQLVLPTHILLFRMAKIGILGILILLLALAIVANRSTVGLAPSFWAWSLLFSVH